MKMLKNPFLLEGLENSFSHPPLLRSLLYYIAAICILTFFWWPRGPLADALRSGQAPQTFTVASIAFLLSLLFLSGRCGLEDFANPESARIKDVITLTPMRISSVVLGKLASGIIHTLFLILLALPILIATRAVSGRSFQDLWAVVAAAGASALCIRALGFMFFVILDERSTTRSLALLGVVAALLLAPFAFFPAATPVSVMIPPASVVGLFGATIPAYAVSAIISLLAAGVFTAASVVRLHFLRRRHAQKAVPSEPAVRRPFGE